MHIKSSKEFFKIQHKAGENIFMTIGGRISTEVVTLTGEIL